MSDYTISISNALYEKAERLAQQTSQQVDEVIRNKLATAFDQPLLDLSLDEQAELQALTYLSDDTLWTIAREQMQSQLQQRMSELMDKNSRGTITETEYTELSGLVERGQRLMTRKAQAMKLLMQHGHTVNLEQLAPTDE